jgi:hypothetical protein
MNEDYKLTRRNCQQHRNNPVGKNPWETDGTQSLKMCQPYTKREGSLPCPQEPDTGLYHEPDESSKHTHVLFHMIFSNIIFFRITVIFLELFVTIFTIIFPLLYVIIIWHSHTLNVYFCLRLKTKFYVQPQKWNETNILCVLVSIFTPEVNPEDPNLQGGSNMTGTICV